MLLEDALLFVAFDTRRLSGADYYDLCRGAISAGADVIALKYDGCAPDASVLKDAARACSEEDALHMVWNDAALVHQLGADGVHLSDPGASIGQARGILGVDSLVGFTTCNAEQAALAAEVGADYIVHMEGSLCPAVFAQLRGVGTASLYAGGLAGAQEAAALIGSGVFRIYVEIGSMDEAKPEVIAEYSRALGRVI